MKGIRGSFRSLLFLGLLALGLAAGSPAGAADFEGIYAIRQQTLTVQVGVAVTERRTTRSFRRSITLVKGQIPKGIFDAEKAFWRTRIESWADLSSRQKEDAVRAMERHYDDLRAQISRYLRGFPDEVTVRGTGIGSANFLFVDDDFGRKQSTPAFYNASQGTFMTLRLPLIRGELGSKGLVFRFGAWSVQGSLPGRQATWRTNASLLGAVPNGGAVAASLNLDGQVALEPAAGK